MISRIDHVGVAVKDYEKAYQHLRNFSTQKTKKSSNETYSILNEAASRQFATLYKHNLLL